MNIVTACLQSATNAYRFVSRKKKRKRKVWEQHKWNVNKIFKQNKTYSLVVLLNVSFVKAFIQGISFFFFAFSLLSSINYGRSWSTILLLLWIKIILFVWRDIRIYNPYARELICYLVSYWKRSRSFFLICIKHRH